MGNKDINSKSRLAIVLSKINGFFDPKVRLEQYMTDSEVGAAILWFSYMNEDINGKIVADLGSGTGILGLGALLLGASKVYLVEIDKDAIDIAKNKYETLKSEYNIPGEAIFINSDVFDFNEEVDVVIENPPFGVKLEHADRDFLNQAMKVSKKIYSLHKSESKGFIDAFSKDNRFKLLEELSVNYPLKQTMEFHKKKIHRFDASWFVLEKA